MTGPRGSEMAEIPESAEVSFFDLAERYEMARGRPKRWRDRRDTLPARRRRRRTHRRDSPPSRSYYPMVVDSRSANRGIQARLVGAMAAALVTVICLISLFLAPITLGSTFALSIAVGSLGLSIALIMSARREEIVHQVAGELTRDVDQPRALPPGSQDGSVGKILGGQDEWYWDPDDSSHPRHVMIDKIY